jgi:Leu/Phe-tRNA-protein transferase
MLNAHDKAKESRVTVPMSNDFRSVIKRMAEEQKRTEAWVIREMVWAALSMAQKVKVA